MPSGSFCLNPKFEPFCPVLLMPRGESRDSQELQGMQVRSRNYLKLFTSHRHVRFGLTCSIWVLVPNLGLKIVMRTLEKRRRLVEKLHVRFSATYFGSIPRERTFSIFPQTEQRLFRSLSACKERRTVSNVADSLPNAPELLSILQEAVNRNQSTLLRIDLHLQVWRGYLLNSSEKTSPKLCIVPAFSLRHECKNALSSVIMLLKLFLF